MRMSFYSIRNKTPAFQTLLFQRDCNSGYVLFALVIIDQYITQMLQTKHYT